MQIELTEKEAAHIKLIFSAHVEKCENIAKALEESKDKRGAFNMRKRVGVEKTILSKLK